MNNFAGWSYLMHIVNVILPALWLGAAIHLTILYRRDRPLMGCFALLALSGAWLLAGELAGSVVFMTAPVRPIVIRSLTVLALAIAVLGKLRRR